MTKEEVIKQAYGCESSLIDENGWATYAVDELGEFGIEPSGYYETRNHVDGVYEWRPKSLKGLETNNGWIKIESEQDLPNMHGSDYWVMLNGKIRMLNRNMNNDTFWKSNVTHYQPIIKPIKPLY